MSSFHPFNLQIAPSFLTDAESIRHPYSHPLPSNPPTQATPPAYPLHQHTPPRPKPPIDKNPTYSTEKCSVQRHILDTPRIPDTDTATDTVVYSS